MIGVSVFFKCILQERVTHTHTVRKVKFEQNHTLLTVLLEFNIAARKIANTFCKVTERHCDKMCVVPQVAKLASRTYFTRTPRHTGVSQKRAECQSCQLIFSTTRISPTLTIHMVAYLTLSFSLSFSLPLSVSLALEAHAHIKVMISCGRVGLLKGYKQEAE